MSSARVFVSYAHADLEYVHRLVDLLRGHGVEVWFDEQIATSRRWDQELEHRIDTCQAVVVVMSEAARKSYWVGVELDHARSQDRPIFPLLLDGKPLFGLGVIQYESVMGGRMPSSDFIRQLRDLSSNPGLVETTTNVRQIGIVPGAADCFQHRHVAGLLDAALTEHGTAIVTQILSGMGGVGKTQLAASVVRQLVARGAVDDLVWVSATTADAIVSTLAEAGVAFASTSADDPVADARGLLAWFATTSRRWLVVFDDLTEPNDLNEWWPPPSTTGRVLVTTRRRDDALLRRGHRINVQQFTSEEAKAYLVAKFDRQPWRLVEVEELASDLGFLPVALAQAAAYVADRDLTCAAYRKRFADHPLAALAPSVWPDAYARPVAVTLSLAVEAANQLDPVGLAKPLLTTLSLLDPNGSPFEIITSAAVVDHLGNASLSAVDGDHARDALSCLTRLNLAEVAASDPVMGDSGSWEAQRVRVHALVQRAARDQASREQLSAAAVAAANAIVAVWPPVERDTGFAQLLRANTAALRRVAEDDLWSPMGGHVLLFRAGRSIGEAGLVKDAIHHFEELVSEATRRLGPDHPNTLRARGGVAHWRGESGDAAGAAAEYEVLHAARLRVLGPDSPHTLRARSNLASWRGFAGDTVGAVAAFEALLADRVRVLGSDHPDTLTTRGNLASWRGEADDAVGAAAAFEALLIDQVRILGPDHPDTLGTRNNLAYWRGETGNAVGAAAAFEALLIDQVRILGPDHPDTLRTRNNLAYWRAEAGDIVGAIAAFETVLVDRLRILGPEHPDTLRTRSNLASWRGEAGDVSGAVAEFEALLVDQLRVLGHDHPSTLTTRSNLAGWRGEAGDTAGAVAALEALLADRRRVLGEEHPATITTANDLVFWRNRGSAGARSPEPEA